MATVTVPQIQKVFYPYSSRIHHLVRNVIRSKSRDVSQIYSILLLNPIMTHPGLNMIPKMDVPQPSITHIPIRSDTDIGVESKVIVWKHGSCSDIHHHPDKHCFFTPLTKGMLQSTLYADAFHGDSRWVTYELSPSQYMYIHDSFGAHQLTNPTSGSLITYHMYINEDALRQ
jgi:hypothetical protein